MSTLSKADPWTAPRNPPNLVMSACVLKDALLGEELILSVYIHVRSIAWVHSVPYLFNNASPAFLRVLELEGLPQQRVERLEGAVVGAGVGRHGKGGHVHHALDALRGKGSSLHGRNCIASLSRFARTLLPIACMTRYKLAWHHIIARRTPTQSVVFQTGQNFVAL